MRSLIGVIILVGFSGCAREAGVNEPSTDTAKRKKTVSEEAFDAGQNARRKAEQIKAEQEKKAQEAVEQTEP